MKVFRELRNFYDWTLGPANRWCHRGYDSCSPIDGSATSEPRLILGMFTFIPLAIFLFCLVVEILAWMPNLIAILTIIGFIVWVVVKFFGRPLVNMFGEYQAYRESKGDDSATQ